MPLKGWKFLSSFILLKSWENSLKEKLFVTVFHLIENITTYICHLEYIYVYKHIHIHTYAYTYIHICMCVNMYVYFFQMDNLYIVLYMLACMCAKSLQSCPTLCDPLDCSPPRSSVHGILQARILEWVTMPSSRGSSQPRDQTHISLSPALANGFFTTSAIWKAEQSSN